MVEWQKEVEKRQSSIIDDLKRLLKIPSFNDEEYASTDAPFGKGPTSALHELLKIGQRDGFKTKNVDNIAGYIELGDSNAEEVGMLVHVDVMPAGSGWKTDPFDPVIKDNKIFARGAFDDKGPAMAAYYAMKIVKELKLPLKRHVKLIIGTDEEIDWRGIKHYLSKYPKPEIGFSPDQDFPIVNGEKGVANSWISFPGEEENKATLLSFQSGERRNMVPRIATSTIKTTNPKEIIEKFNNYVEQQPVTGKSKESPGKLTLTVYGKAAHAQEPADGYNGATYLASFLQQLKLDPSASHFIDFIADYLHQDSRMKKWKLAYRSPTMGDLTVNAGVFNYDWNKGGQITLNYRYPKEIYSDDIFNRVKEVVSKFNASVKSRVDLTPHYVDPDKPIVKTLLGVYHRQTGLPAKGKTVGGGTFGRLLPDGVAFGARFPGTPSSIHQPNEFIPLHDLFAATSIYAESIYRLAN